MPQLYQTTRDNRHDHVIYVREDGFTACSVDKKHVHEIILLPSSPMTDDMGRPQLGPDGSPVMGPPIIQIAEADNHTHDYLDLDVADIRPKHLSDSKLIARVHTLYREAREYEASARKKAEESEAFYRGHQWDKEIKDYLEGNELSCLTMNFVESTMDFLLGVQRQNRTDWRWHPTEDGDSRVADILNVLTKNISERAKMPHTENRIFEDVAVAGRGFFHVYLDRDETVRGRIAIDHYPWKDVFCGPHDDLLGRDMEHQTRKRWYSLANIRNMFPDKAKKLDVLESTMEDLPSSDLFQPPGAYGATTSSYVALPHRPINIDLDPDLVDIAKKDIALLECWQKEYHTIQIIVDPEASEDGWVFNAGNVPPRLVSKIKTIPTLQAIPRTMKRFRVTKIAGSLVLSDTYADTPFNDFDLVPVYAKKKGKEFWGKVESGKDPQRQINKTASKLSDIFNKFDNYGYWYDEETFDTQQDKNAAINGVSQPGFFLKCKSVDRRPVKEEGIKFPNEVAGILNTMLSLFRGVMNVDPMAMGQTLGSRESGLAIENKVRQTLTGNEFLYDNFSLSKAHVGRMVVSLIKDSFTPDRVMRIIANQAVKEPVLIGGQTLDVPGAARPRPMPSPDGGPSPEQQEQLLQMEEVQRMFANADLLEYDVEAGAGPYGPTARAANQQYMLQLAATPVGQYLPPQLFLEFMDIPDKDKIMAAINQQMQSMQQSANAKQEAEIQKTLIAAQSKQQG